MKGRFARLAVGLSAAADPAPWSGLRRRLGLLRALGCGDHIEHGGRRQPDRESREAAFHP
jgi:hypothetical protein